MEKAFQRIVSVILSVSVLIGIFSFCFGAFADEDPALTLRSSVVISKNGTNTDFGEKYNSIAGKTKITLSPTIDLKDESFFEFDIFIEDYSSFLNAVSDEGQGLGFYFGSNTSPIASAQISSNYAFVDITGQIKMSGWNHISASKSDFSETGINWAKVKFVFLKFNNNISSNYPEKDSKSLKNSVLKLRNICSVYSMPEIGGGKIKIYSGYFSFVADEDLNAIGVDGVDISSCTHIGFDYKPSDKSAFNALVSAGKVKLILIAGDKQCKITIQQHREIAHPGWYGAVASIDDSITSEITAFDIEIMDGTDSIILEVANVYAINMHKEYSDAAYGSDPSQLFGDKISLTAPKKYDELKIGVEDQTAPIHDAEFIEFDLFVEDNDLFRSSFIKDKSKGDISASLDLTLYNADETKNLVFSNIQSKAIITGWNHIVLPISSAVNNGFDFGADVFGWKMDISGADGKELSYVGNYIIIENIFASKTGTPEKNEAYDTVSVLQDGHRRFDLKNTFSSSGTGDIKLTDPVDLKRAMFVEFDLYIQNYEAWKKAMSEGGYKEIQMRISSDPSNPTRDCKTADFATSVIGSGWNHICIPFGNFVKGNTSGTLDPSSVAVYNFYYGGRDTSKTGETGLANGMYISVANISGTAIKTPSDYAGINTVISDFDIAPMSGNYGDRYSLSLTGAAADPLDISKAAFIEFDVYIKDYNSFVRSFSSDVDGKDVGVALNFGIGRGTSYNESNGYYQWSSIEQFVKNEGWNHISLALGGQSRSKGKVTVDGTEIPTLTEIQCIKIWYGGDAYKTGDYKNIIGSELALFANFTATVIENPPLPSNVLAIVGKADESGNIVPSGISGALGEKFHYPTGRFYENKFSGIDFKGTIIEFDVYVDDLEALRRTEAISTVRKSFLCLMLSSTPAYLWGQYDRPDEKFSAYVNITDKLTKNGWNHIRVGKANFTNYAQTLDWSNITGWQMRFYNSTNVHPEDNPNPNVFVKICNIVNTGVVSNLPKDGVKASTPDITATYISTADALGNEFGTWNPTTRIYNSEDYKSEGESSVFVDLNYLSKTEDTAMYFLFDDTADLSDFKSLRLDLFVDLPNLIDSKTNKAEIVLSNGRKIDSDYAKWNINLSTLKSGWNSLEFDAADLVRSGDFKFGEVKNICLRFTEINVDPDVFGEIKIGIDNLRYISTLGRTALKINLDDYNDSGSDSSFVDDFDADEIIEENNDQPQKVKTRLVKTLDVITDYDYQLFSIVIGAVALILAAVVILYRTKLLSRLFKKTKN